LDVTAATPIDVNRAWLQLLVQTAPKIDIENPWMMSGHAKTTMVIMTAAVTAAEWRSRTSPCVFCNTRLSRQAKPGNAHFVSVGGEA
jgi:hypothetical protein